MKRGEGCRKMVGVHLVIAGLSFIFISLSLAKDVEVVEVGREESDGVKVK